ncbi:hypothetical protein BS78_10G237400 [Paspalum vaginatum]|nr:hypothetical protein BS78_10G237400 [Paspalum vaginatum]
MGVELGVLRQPLLEELRVRLHRRRISRPLRRCRSPRPSLAAPPNPIPALRDAHVVQLAAHQPAGLHLLVRQLGALVDPAPHPAQPRRQLQPPRQPRDPLLPVRAPHAVPPSAGLRRPRARVRGSAAQLPRPRPHRRLQDRVHVLLQERPRAAQRHRVRQHPRARTHPAAPLRSGLWPQRRHHPKRRLATLLIALSRNRPSPSPAHQLLRTSKQRLRRPPRPRRLRRHRHPKVETPFGEHLPQPVSRPRQAPARRREPHSPPRLGPSSLYLNPSTATSLCTVARRRLSLTAGTACSSRRLSLKASTSSRRLPDPPVPLLLELHRALLTPSPSLSLTLLKI